MSNKSVEHYFNTAKSIPTVMTYAQIEQLVNVKGIVKPPSKPFWWNLNFYLMTLTATTIISLGLIFNPLNSEPKYSSTSSIEPIQQQHNEMDRENLLVLVLEEDSSHHEETMAKVMELEPTESKPYLEFNDDSAFEIEQQIALPDTFIQEIQKLTQYIKTQYADTIEEIFSAGSSFEYDKEIVLEQNLDGVEWFELNNSKADLTIHAWEKNEVKLIAKAKIETHDNEDLDEAVEDFELNFKKKGNRLSVDSEWEDLLNCSCSIDKKKGLVKTKKGEKVRISKIVINYEVYLPNHVHLNLDNGYAVLTVPDWKGELKLRSFKGEMKVGKAQSDVTLSQNYGNAQINEFKDMTISLFKSTLSAGNGLNLSGKSNYSNLEVGQVEELKLSTFKGDSHLKGVSQSVDANVRYGDMIIDGKSLSGKYYGFKAKYVLDQVDEAELSASYSTFKGNGISDLEITKAFRSELELGNVNQLEGDLRYTPMEIKNLKESMNVVSFKGTIDVGNVEEDFKLLKAEAKYTDLEFNMNKASAYNINLESYYAGVNMPEQNILLKYREDYNHGSKVEASVNGGDLGSKVELNLFKGSLDFK